MMRRKERQVFDWLLTYEDHNKERKERCETMEDTDRIAEILVRCVEGIDRHLAVRIVGILFTNCYELGAFGKQRRSFYPLVCLINHSCIPNLRKVPTLRGGKVVMKLESQRAIRRGSQLTVRYNNGYHEVN